MRQLSEDDWADIVDIPDIRDSLADLEQRLDDLEELHHKTVKILADYLSAGGRETIPAKKDKALLRMIVRKTEEGQEC